MRRVVTAAWTVLAAAIATTPAAADGCRQFGRPNYSADRTIKIGKETFRVRFFTDGVNEREETQRGGNLDVRLRIEGRMVVFDPASKRGIELPMPPAVSDPQRSEEVVSDGSDGAKIVRLIVRQSGTPRSVSETLCRPDGIMLRHKGTLPLGDPPKPAELTITQSNFQAGPIDPELFKIPANIEIRKMPLPPRQQQ